MYNRECEHFPSNFENVFSSEAALRDLNVEYIQPKFSKTVFRTIVRYFSPTKSADVFVFDAVIEAEHVIYVIKFGSLCHQLLFSAFLSTENETKISLFYQKNCGISEQHLRTFDEQKITVKVIF